MQFQGKIYNVYDYRGVDGYLPNAINPDFLRSLIKHDYSFNNGFLDDFQKKYNDGFSVFNCDGVLYDNDILDNNISSIEVQEKLWMENRDENFYLYNITPFGGGSSTFGYPYTHNEGRSFFYFIPKLTRKMIEEKDNFYLMVNYGNEGTLDRFWFNVIHHDANLFNIPLNKIVFVVSDFTIKETYDDYCKENNFDKQIKVFPVNWSLSAKSEEYKRLLNDEKTSFNNNHNICSVVKKEDVNLEVTRNKHFVMFNRRLRPHRYYSILLFNKMNILDKFDISFDFDTCRTYDFTEDGYSYHGTDSKFRDLLLKENEKVLNGELTKSIIDYDDLPNVWGFNFEQKESYLNSYIHIITETNFFERGLYLSEKTWKPMGQLQPFIMMGPVGSLKLIRSYGFKTFDGFIDERYDTIENNEERFKFLIKEIERLSNLSKEELKNWYKSIFSDILVHNQKVLIDYKSKDKKDIREQFLNLLK